MSKKGEQQVFDGTMLMLIREAVGCISSLETYQEDHSIFDSKSSILKVEMEFSTPAM